MKPLRRIKSLYIYRAVSIAAQLFFYRELALNMSFANVGEIAQIVSFCLIIAAVARFGCHTSISNSILETGRSPAEKKKFALAYVFQSAATSILPMLLLLFLLTVTGQISFLFLLSILFALNITFSFVERARGDFKLISLMDPSSSYVILVLLYAFGLWHMHSVTFVVASLLFTEFFKFFLYLLISFPHLGFMKIDPQLLSIKRRAKYFYNDFLSILTSTGMHVYFPFLFGAELSGKFFLLQRLSFPLQFLLNTKNAILVSQYIKAGSEKKASIYFRSLKALVIEGALFSSVLLASHGPILAFFGIPDLGLAYALVLSAYFFNLATGPSAPLFNVFGTPEFNLYSNLFAFLFLAIAAAVVGHLFGPEILVVCLMFMLTTLLRNGLVYLFVKRVLSS